MVSEVEGRDRPYHQSMVSDWTQGASVPSPRATFALEEVLGCAPGQLSEHLGYLPPSARGDVASVPDAIDADPALDARSRRALKNLYATLAEPSSRAS